MQTYNTGAWQDRITLLNDGKVGIGKTPTQSLDVSGNINMTTGGTYKINGTDVLSSSTLGSGVTSSSLTSVGTLNNLGISGTLAIDNSGGTTISGTITGASNAAISASASNIITMNNGAIWSTSFSTSNRAMLVLLYESNSGYSALFLVGNSGSNLISQLGNYFNNNYNNASTINVYADTSSGTQVRIQNNKGATVYLHVQIIALRQ